MTNEQKANIVRLRYSGWGYRKISIALDIPRDPIRTYCKSMGLDGYAKDLVRKKEAIQLEGNCGDSLCRQCGKPDTYHGSAGRILQNKKYVGTYYYPPIIDEEIFRKAQEERKNRAVKLGRVRRAAENLPILSPAKFSLKSNEIIFDDPFKQAEYAYSMIESEWF